MKQSALLLAVCFIQISLAQSDGLPRGAYDMPYTRYEAEEALAGGGAVLESAPTFIQSLTAAEASNQKYVALPSAGSSVAWTMTTTGAGITLRFTMPDGADGEGLQGSLNVYVNGALAKTVSLTSRYAYQYFHSTEPEQTPGGKTRMRFDEKHFLLDAPLATGDVLKIQKDGDAHTYGVDFVEIEDVAPPAAMPGGYISVTSCGADGSDETDDLAAFHACLANAKAQGANLFIPPGRYFLSEKLNIDVANMKITGAGMWHTELYFSTDLQFRGGIYGTQNAGGLEISDFYLHTVNNDRLVYGSEGTGIGGMYKTYKGFMGTYGSNTKIHHVWIEHFECGFWIAGYDYQPIPITDNLTISYLRIRNNYADGINFCQGTSHSVVEHSNIRNSGDDGLAVWPNNALGVTQAASFNTFRYNTIEHNWRAGSIALFGGEGHEVHHNLIRDGFAGSGIRFTTDFPGFTFMPAGAPIQVYENTIIRCGTSFDLWDRKRGAIEFNSSTGIMNIDFSNIDIIDAQRHGIQIAGNALDDIHFSNITIDGAGLDTISRNAAMDVYGGFGVIAEANSNEVTFNNLATSNTESGPSFNRNQNFKLTITNENVSLTGISLTPAASEAGQGEVVKLTLAFLPEQATSKKAAWTSSDTGVAALDVTGTFGADARCKAVGTATITVTSEEGGFTASAVINVVPAVNVTTLTEAVNEGVQAEAFTIATSGISTDITVAYTVSGTAAAADYTPALSGSVTLTPAAPAAIISLTALADVAFEGHETLIITLTESPNYRLGGKTQASITIIDGDAPPCEAPAVAFTAEPLTIDGTVEAKWSDAPVGSIASVTIGAKPADFEGSWQAMYDGDNLYLLVEVADGSLKNEGGDWWMDDVIEINLDGDNSKGNSYDNANDFQLGFRYGDNTIHIGDFSVSNTEGIVHSLTDTDAGYRLEVSVPWTLLGGRAMLGRVIGLDVVVDDDDDGGARDAQVAAFSSSSQSFSDPSLFGSVYLTKCVDAPAPVAVHNSALKDLSHLSRLFAGALSMSFLNQYQAQYRAIDQRGRVFETGTLNSSSALGGRWDAGMYIIELKTGGVTSVFKAVKFK